MNEIVLSRDEARSIDAAAVTEIGIDSMLLMENAARGIHDVLMHRKSDGRIVIVCGPGNNGGDGLALRRQLAAFDQGAEVYLVRAGKELTHDASANLKLLQMTGIEVVEVASPQQWQQVVDKLDDEDTIVDCVLGTGVRGAVAEPFRSIIESINASKANVIAVDVPSGLDCDRGTAEGVCVRASHTVTFVGMKQGFLAEQAQQFTGRVSVAPIGLPAPWVREWLAVNRAAM